MAKTMAGTMTGDVSGSVGNATFGRGRYGGMVRMRVKPRKVVNVNTVRVQGGLSLQSRAWAALTSDQKRAWELYSKAHPIKDVLGQSMVVGGKGTFCELNGRLAACELTTLVVPPLESAPASVITPNVNWGGPPYTLRTTFDVTVHNVGDFCWFFVNVTSGRREKRPQDNMKCVLRSTINTLGFIDLGAYIVARFGTLLEGQTVTITAAMMGETTGLMGVVTMVSAKLA